MRKRVLALLTAATMLCASVNVFALDYTNKETIKSVQQALNDAGYDCGTPDGSAGTKTQNAIAKYRADKGLASSNQIDDELAASLGLLDSAAESTQPTSMIHLDTEYGILDLVRYEVHNDELFLIYDFTNTTDETTMPLMQFLTQAFQDGIEIDTSFSLSKPDDCDDSTKNIRPGAKLRYCSVFKLNSESPVEIEVRAMMDFYKKDVATYTINLTEESPVVESSTAEISSASNAAPSNDNSAQLQADLDAANARIKELESQLEEANKTIADLQSQIDTIKSALGA